jgi:hypothetical protein
VRSNESDSNDEIQAVEDNVIQKPRAWHAGYRSAIDQDKPRRTAAGC